MAYKKNSMSETYREETIVKRKQEIKKGIELECRFQKKYIDENALDLAVDRVYNNEKLRGSELSRQEMYDIYKNIYTARLHEPIERDANKRAEKEIVTTKKSTSDKRIRKAIIGLLLVAGGAYYVNNTFSNESIGRKIGQLASEVNSYDNNNKVSIPRQNMEELGYDPTANEIVFNYTVNSYSLDVLRASYYESGLFDIVMCNCFFTSENKLETLDKIVLKVRTYLSEDNFEETFCKLGIAPTSEDAEKYTNNLKEISKELEGCKTFVEYLYKNNLVDIEKVAKKANCTVEDIEKAVKEYSENREDSNTYGTLDKKGQKIIEEIKNEYKNKTRLKLYWVERKDLNDAVTEHQKGDMRERS